MAESRRLEIEKRTGMRRIDLIHILGKRIEIDVDRASRSSIRCRQIIPAGRRIIRTVDDTVSVHQK